MTDRLGHELLELIDVERFLDVVERPMTHGLHGRGHRGMRGHHHHLGGVTALLQVNDEFQPAHPGHSQVGDDAVVALPLDDLDRLSGAGAAIDLVAGPAERVAHRFAGLRVIVDHQHAAGRGQR